MIHIVCSDGRGRRKTKQAQDKLQQELDQTLNWEKSWKIRSNPNKSTVHCMASTKDKLVKLGGIRSDNNLIPISASMKILGTHLHKLRNINKHINHNISKAKTNLKKLNRFKSAPRKIKKNLFKLLIRPILEYPTIITEKADKTHKKKMQIIQNNAIRFILNVKNSDRTNMENAHKELDLLPLNIRISKLANKVNNKAKDYYIPSKKNKRPKIYKYSDYEIENPPLRKQRKSLFERVNSKILKVRNHKPIFKNLKSIEKWVPPTPIYTS